MPSRISCSVGVGLSFKQIDSRQDHAGRAVAALQAVLLPESFLQGMEPTVVGQAFDRHDLGAVRLNREERARLGATPIDQHGAGAALARVAPDVRAGQIEVLAQEVDQKQSRLYVHRAHLAIDGDRDFVPSVLSMSWTPGRYGSLTRWTTTVVWPVAARCHAA